MRPRSLLSMALYDYRRGMLGWGVATFLFLLLMSAFYPSLVGIEGLEDLLSDYPPALLSLFGIDDAAVFATATGYVEGELFSFLVPLTMIGFGVAVGARFVAGEEERGGLGLTLARPVSRARFVLWRAAALAILAVGLAVVVLASLLLARPVFRLDVPVGNLAAAVTATAALAVLFGFVALAAGAASGSRAAASATGWSLALLAFLWNGLAPLVRGLTELAWLSPYEWALGEKPLRTGFDLEGLGWVTLLAVVVLAVAVVAFDRRDVAG